MNDLVKITNGEALTTSNLIAEKFEKSHDRVLKSIDKLRENISDVTRQKKRTREADYIFIEKSRSVRGREFRYVEMNRNAFSLLAMGFTGKKALNWKMDFIHAFNAMEKTLLNQQSLEWKQQREQGKLIRREETDVIQKFVEYASGQGSKNSKWYYKHFTNATYKALQLVEHKQPKLRDTLDMLELNQLLLAENVALRSLEENMKTGEHYKAIFANVKHDIEKFASTLFLPKLNA